MKKEIDNANDKLPYGYEIIISMEIGSVNIFLSVMNGKTYEVEDKTMLPVEQINHLVSLARKLRGPRSICLSCSKEHDNVSIYCDACSFV